MSDFYSGNSVNCVLLDVNLKQRAKNNWFPIPLRGNEYGGLHGREFLGRTLMILILTNQAVFVTLSVVKILSLAQPSLF